PAPPSSRNPALSPSVDAVIMRGLAKDANARWESCAAFVDALAAALAGATPEKTVPLPPPQTATRPLAAGRAPKTAAASTVAVALPGQEATAATVAVAMPERIVPAPKPPRSRRRFFEILAAAAILLLLLLAGSICAAAGQKPTLSISPRVAGPGRP